MAFSPEETYNFDDDLTHRPLVDEWNEASLALLDRAWDVVLNVARDLNIKDPHAELKNFEVETLVSAGEGWRTVVDSQKWKKGDLLFVDSSPQSKIRPGYVHVGPHTAEFLSYAPVPVIVLRG